MSTHGCHNARCCSMHNSPANFPSSTIYVKICEYASARRTTGRKYVKKKTHTHTNIHTSCPNSASGCTDTLHCSEYRVSWLGLRTPGFVASLCYVTFATKVFRRQKLFLCEGSKFLSSKSVSRALIPDPQEDRTG